MVISMLFLITFNHGIITDVFLNSIQVYVEVNMYHLLLDNEDWNPKIYVPRTPCSYPVSTIAGSSMTGGTMNWIRRSYLWGQQHTS